MDLTLRQYLKNTKYRFVNASYLTIHQIQDHLKKCRIDKNLVVYVNKTYHSKSFFQSLIKFKLDEQNSNHYIAHYRNYATWIDESELTKLKLLAFLTESSNAHEIEKKERIV